MQIHNYTLYLQFQTSIQKLQRKRIQGEKGLNGESARPHKLFNVSMSFASGFLEIQIRKLNFSFRQGIIQLQTGDSFISDTVH